MRSAIERLLTKDELVELTGFRLQSRICRALRDHGIRFVTRRDGWPATTWAAVNTALGGKGDAIAESEEPDLSFLSGGM